MGQVLKKCCTQPQTAEDNNQSQNVEHKETKDEDTSTNNPEVNAKSEEQVEPPKQGENSVEQQDLKMENKQEDPLQGGGLAQQGSQPGDQSMKTATEISAPQDSGVEKTSSTALIFIVIQSILGHTSQLAEAIKKGIEQSGKAKAEIYQVQGLHDNGSTQQVTLNYPIIQPDDLEKPDGLMFGFEASIGSFPETLKALFDHTGKQWMSGGLYLKPAGIFVTSSMLGDSQEAGALSILPFLTHQGMIFVPVGFPNPKLFGLDDVRGASAWSSGSISGVDGKREPNELEIENAQIQGEKFVDVVSKLKK